MSNSSATGGYLSPTTTPLPGGLSFEDFFHDVIVGITGFDKTLVRPKWQTNPPKQPDISIDWISFALQNLDSDQFAYISMDNLGNSTLKRHERLEIQCSFYGPNGYENMTAFHDGFQLQQNNDALRAAGMGFIEARRGVRGPDLVNERWVQRWETSVILARQVLRSYPILSLVSANGTIHTVVGANYNLNWKT